MSEFPSHPDCKRCQLMRSKPFDYESFVKPQASTRRPFRDHRIEILSQMDRELTNAGDLDMYWRHCRGNDLYFLDVHPERYQRSTPDLTHRRDIV